MVESSSIVLTIGHSTHALDEFIRLLQAHGVSCVVDVRTLPRSRHNPQFNKASLPRALKKDGLKYVHLPVLGGLRHAKRDSLNVGWRNASFRGFALKCAEAVPWRCHRSLITDALLVHRIRTEHIMSLTRRQIHTLTPFARVRGIAITYPIKVSTDNPKKPLAKRSAPRRSKETDSH